MQVFEAKPLFTPATAGLRFLPEGPRLLQNYPSPDPILGWVAIQESFEQPTGSVNLLNLRTLDNESHPLPGRCGFFAETDRPGVIAVGLERSLVLYDLVRQETIGAPFAVTNDARTVINDGLSVQNGLLFGTKHIAFQERIAAMFLLDAPSRRLHTLHPSQICANGKHIVPGGLIDIDSPNKTLDFYPFDRSEPSLGERRILADFRDTPLFPDGLRPTAGDESVVVAFYNPEPAPEGVAREFRLSDGAVMTEWRLPGSPRVTCPEIFNWDGATKILFTTAVEGMEPAVPLAGTIFIADTPWAAPPPRPPLFSAAALGG